MANKSILLYGDSGDGKSTLLGEFAEYVFKTTKLKTRLYSADRGGAETIRPYIDLGIIDLIQLEGDPWIWLNSAVRGKVRKNGKWEVDHQGIGFWAFESLTSMADEFMSSLATKAGQGINIGGGANVSFKVQEGADTVMVSGNNMSHFGVAQSRITAEVWESQKLPGWLAWTAAVKRDEDPNSVGKILGPAVAGKALTGELPRWFMYTFRVSAVPGMAGAPEKHILFLGDHSDASSGNAKGLGNTRVPLDSPKIPTTIEPASLVKAIELIQGSYQPALVAIKKRLNITEGVKV